MKQVKICLRGKDTPELFVRDYPKTRSKILDGSFGGIPELTDLILRALVWNRL